MDNVIKAYRDTFLTEEKKNKKPSKEVVNAVHDLEKEIETIQEESLSPSVLKKREDFVMKLKKHKSSFQEKYGDDWESVLYATATKLAKQSENE